jgi:carbon storage regulator
VGSHSHNKEVRMLVLSRKLGETICIDNNIKVTVIAVKGDQVRLGIEAPTDVPVHRKEVYDKINSVVPPTEQK